MLHTPDTKLKAVLDEDGEGVRIEVDDFPLPPYWAPREFVAEFRTATQNPELDICWDPCADLMPNALISDDGWPGLWHPRRVWGDRGCWKVLGLISVQKTMKLATGAKLEYPGKMYTMAHVLNGIHGLPTHMGMWFAGVMAESDLTLRWQLLRAKRAAHRKAFDVEHKRQDSWADTYGNDSYVRGIQKRLAANKSEEHQKLEERLVHARKESRARDRAAQLKEMGL